MFWLSYCCTLWQFAEKRVKCGIFVRFVGKCVCFVGKLVSFVGTFEEFWFALHGLLLCSEQFGNADEVVGDQVEQEIGADACDPAMLGLAQGAVLLAPAENAFDHFAARLRHAVAFMPGGATIDSALARLSGLGGTVVLSHMWRDVRGAQGFDMIGCIIGLVFADRDGVASRRVS